MPRCDSGPAVHDGDSLTASSTVIGLKENSSRETGIVYVRTEGRNQRGETVLSFVRWVMVRKRDKGAPAPAAVVPQLAESVSPDLAALPAAGDRSRGLRHDLAGSPHLWDDYEPGERIDHVDGMTIEESCHMTRDAALPEHRQGPFQPACGEGRALRPAHRLWRPCHQPGPRPQLQWPGQCLPHRRDQCRASRQSLLRRGHGLCLERGEGEARASRPRRRCAAPQDHRHQGPALRRFSRRGPRDPARPRLHGADAPAVTSHPDPPRKRE